MASVHVQGYMSKLRKSIYFYCFDNSPYYRYQRSGPVVRFVNCGVVGHGFEYRLCRFSTVEIIVGRFYDMK